MERFEYAFISLGDETYWEDIASALADVFDIGVNACGIEGQAIADAFVASGLARQFELQNPVYVAGRSGSELLNMLMPYLDMPTPVEPSDRFGRTPEYWLGWVLGLHQAQTGQPYKRIFETIPFAELVDMYYPLHEAPESKFSETLRQRMHQASEHTRLRLQRDAAGLSQSELAKRANVGLRSIQLYEQRNKDINRAQGATLVRLSRTLHCDVEDLLEVG